MLDLKPGVASLLFIILGGIALALPNQPSTSSAPQALAISVDFAWTPKFVLAGDVVNFTAVVSDGTPPYSYAWTFGDGQTASGAQVLHTFTSPATYSVTLSVTDSTAQTNSITHPVVVQVWPVATYGWLVRWNITPNDGISIWNVTFRNVLVINDVRIPGVQVLYKSNFCGPFYDEPFDETKVKSDGNIFYENSTDPLNQFFQLRAEYRVPGYSYMETFRFYPTGKWGIEFTIARGGCAFDHIYEPHMRFDLAIGDPSHNFLSKYTPSGGWQNLIWEGNYTGTGFSDPAHNGAQWRTGDEGMYYYIAPTIIRSDLDLPNLPSSLILLYARPNEIELSHPLLGIENPVVFVNGEFAFRQNIAFWFMPRIWDHGPVSIAPPKIITVTFHPYGTWP